MKKIKIIIHLIIIISINSVMSQDFSSHKWKDRLLVIQTKNIENKTFTKQLNELKDNKVGLKDRNILVYILSDNKLKSGLENNSDWLKTNPKDKTSLFKNSKSSFEILLIGLDGQVKLREQKILKCETLFSIIDVMPMRAQEIKKRN